MARRVEGVVTPLGPPRTFDVVPLRGSGTLPGAPREEVSAFQRALGALRGQAGGALSAIDEALQRVRGIQEVLDRATLPDTHLDDAARAIERELNALRVRLDGDPVRERHGAPGPVPISRRIDVATMGTRYATYGPTRTHRRALEIAREGLSGLRAELERLLLTELPGLERRLDAAGVPWSPSRP
jgi:hypothetical protein